MDVGFVTLAKKSFKEFGNDNAARLGAALAYYTFSSFFPLLLVLISLIGIALSLNLGSAENARAFVLDSVASTLPAARDLIAESFRDTEQNSGTLGVVGLLTGLWAASNIFAQLEMAFNVIFDVVPRDRSLIETLKARAQAAGIVLLIAVLMVGSLVLGTVLTTVENFAQGLPGGAYLAWALNVGVSLALSTLVFALLFKYLPDKIVTWKAALIGGLVTSVTWQIGRELLTWWLGRASSSVTAGTVVGSVLAFLALVYYASQIILLGAEVAATYDELANPDLVRHKTSEDSALRGPGQPPATESGEMATTGDVRGRVAAQQPRLVGFALGFLAGVMALTVGARAVLGNMVDRVASRF